METSPETASRPQMEDDGAWNAIAASEKVLESAPEDRAALGTLADAYERIGDHIRAREHLLRLCGVLLKAADVPAARVLMDRLRSFAEDDADAAAMVKRIEQAGPGAEAAQAGKAPPATAGVTSAARGIPTDFDMAAELSFAWSLLEAGEFSQDEYAAVVQDLTEMSGNERGGAVSVLHVLEARGHKNIDRIVAFAAKSCATPVVTLSCFDLNVRMLTLLPRDFAVRRGALAFERLGPDVMVAVLNPHDAALRKDVEQLAGGRCHFFLSLASEFDRAVVKLDAALADRAAAAPGQK